MLQLKRGAVKMVTYLNSPEINAWQVRFLANMDHQYKKNVGGIVSVKKSLELTT